MPKEPRKTRPKNVTKGIFYRRNNAFHPSDEHAQAMMAGIPDETEIVVSLHKSRNIRQLRLYWKICHVVAENVESFNNDAEYVSYCLKIACHEADTLVEPDTGVVHLRPRSIAFENMEQEAFESFFKRACFVICERWLPGVGSEAFEREILNLIDGPELASLGRRIR